jgi:hypothetical protein
MLSSCALFPKANKPQPNMVMIVNNTDVMLQNVMAREAHEKNDEANRLLSVSNLPAGRYCSLTRNRNSKPLASKIVVSWETGGRQQSVPADISRTLDAVTGAPDEVLVVRILPIGDVMVRLERLGSLEPALRP